MATGTGKTFIAFKLCTDYGKVIQKTILFLADEIFIDQTLRGDFKHFKEI